MRATLSAQGSRRVVVSSRGGVIGFQSSSMQVVRPSLTPRQHLTAMAASSPSSSPSGPSEPEQQGPVGGGFHHETREQLERMGAVVHEEEFVMPHHTGRNIPDHSEKTPSRGPQHVGVGASGEAGSLDMMQGREPANAADQDAATRTASSSASGPSVSSSRSPDGPTATHSEADPEMAGMEPLKERESVDLSMRGLEGDPPVADRGQDAGSDLAAERQAGRYPGGGAAGANAASGAVELTSNEAPSDEEGGLGAVPRRH